MVPVQSGPQRIEIQKRLSNGGDKVVLLLQLFKKATNEGEVLDDLFDVMLGLFRKRIVELGIELVQVVLTESADVITHDDGGELRDVLDVEHPSLFSGRPNLECLPDV